MAAEAISLSSQLNNKLTTSDVPIQDRLHVAKIVFISTNIPILQKEDFIMEYLITCFRETENIWKEQVLKTINSCLSSHRMKCFTGIIRPSVVHDLLKVLGTLRDYDGLKQYSIGCAIELLNTRYFQRLFACDVAALCKLMGILFSSADKDSKDECLKSINHFLFISKMTLLKEDLRVHFIQEAFVPMCSAWTLSSDFSFRDKIIHCIVQIVLFESSFIDTLLDRPLAIGLPNSELLLAISKIKALPTEFDVQVVSACYSLLLRAVVAKLQNPTEEDYKCLFRMFEVLSKQLGLTVDKIESVSIGPVRGWEANSSFSVICEMIKVLDDARIPLKMEFEGYSLETWMISLVIGMTSINLTNLTPALLNMDEAAFRLNPLIIEPCIKVIVQVMLRPKTQLAHPSYIRLMLAAVEGTEHVKRLQKFISLVLGSVRSTLMGSFDENLTVDDVLPSEVGSAFSVAVKTFSNTQALSTMKGLLYHLEADSLAHVEAGCIDGTVMLNTEIIVAVLNKLLFGVKFADHSVPDVIKAKFKSQLEDLRNLLRKFGVSILSTHHDRLLRSYLQLCRTYGTIQLLFDDYDGCPIKPLSANDLKPTNLQYVHPYLTSDQWRKIFKRVMTHDGCLAKQDLMRLLVQKITAVAQVEVGTEGPGSQAARYLLEVADLEWVWSQVVELAPLFQAKELDSLIKTLVKSCKNDQSRWKTLIINNETRFLENRNLILATGLRLLQKAGKIIRHSKSNRSLTSEVMSHLVVDDMLEYELSQLITEDVELAEQIDEATVKMANLIKASISVKKEALEENTVVKIPHQSYFEVVKMLPLHTFTVLNQSCVLLSIVSLLYDLPPQDNIDIYLLDNLCNLLDAPQRHSYKLLGHLDPGLLIKFLTVRAENYPHLRDLMNKICNVALSDRDTAKQLMKCVSEPKKDTIWVTTMVIQAIKKVKRISREESDDDYEEDISHRKKELNKQKCINSLVELATPILLDENPTQQLLPDYAVILKHELANKESENLEKLLLKLGEYSQIAIRDSNEDGGTLVKVMMYHRKELGSYFPKCLVNIAWMNLLNETETETVPLKEVADLVFSSANTEEFSEIIAQLLSHTVSEVKNVTERQQNFGLERLLTLWCYLIQQTFPYDKCKIRADGLVHVVTPIIDLITSWSKDEYTLESVPHLLGFYSILLPILSVELKPVVIDTILLSLSAVPLKGNNRETVITRLSLVIDTLFSLYLFRTSLILDRLPAILQRYRNCLLALAPLAEPSSEDIIAAMSIAAKLERVARTMVKRRKHFTRVSPYIVADIIGIFGKYQIHADIKNVYTNIINAFLAICDSHAVTYLKSILPLASKELFKGIYDNYNKHHRYVGKI